MGIKAKVVYGFWGACAVSLLITVNGTGSIVGIQKEIVSILEEDV
jgi:hypothetical protein